jgi:hypothetical protein
MPSLVSSLIATNIADQNGFTGSEQALHLRRLFPLELVRCVVVLQRGVIKLFGSTARTTTSGDGEAVPIDTMFCGR